ILGETTWSAIKIVHIPHSTSEIKEMKTSGLTEDSIKDYYKQSVNDYINEIKTMEVMKSASHIVAIEDYEVVENDDGIGWIIYIRMELLTNLVDYIDQNPLEIKDVIKLGIQILTALEFCHDRHLIHRDIKPSNIFVSPFGEYKLGDFGISKEVERTNATLSQKGTKSYMAPEMISGRKYGKDVDMYALG
ncbi:protein kinase domain-containing protein, partial [Massilimicrobiota timonensis]|uniref:protein kinase domain-containing protein n=1 Tax=Massilimicrobiota timonensis TaxID=1776392 RepID=UPI001961D7DE